MTRPGKTVTTKAGMEPRSALSRWTPYHKTNEAVHREAKSVNLVLVPLSVAQEIASLMNLGFDSFLTTQV